MKETILEVAIQSPSDLQRFGDAVAVFARWRERSEPTSAGADRDGPELMIRSAYSDTGERKVLIFQERRDAAAFLQLWRSELRRKHG
jgi:hypothetical protein